MENLRNTKNATIDAILTRRSCRSYKQEQISDEHLSTILKCGIYAPSARNKQPWDIACVQNKALLDDINEKCILFIKEHNPDLAKLVTKPGMHIFHNSPTVIFISGDNDNNKFSVMDCSLATENMLIAANSLGVGSCVIGSITDFFNHEDSKIYRQKLDITNLYDVFLAVSFGYPNMESERKIERYEDRIRKY